ncbi:MAG TPA: hypothetical protein VHZ52_14675 [Acidobacteriaceae bacterium]|nr:hypothetical protein [Acidobacteriaceae bacterium]
MKHLKLPFYLPAEDRRGATLERLFSNCLSNRSRRLFLRSQFALSAAMLALLAIPCISQTPKSDWKTQIAEAMPLLGHRNWILVVDSAYPLETSRGVETVETNTDELTVVHSVLESINSSRHVRPVITLDSELAFVPDEDAPGASAYRAQIGKLLQGYEVQSQPHEAFLKAIDKEGRTYRVLVLKTNMAIPYTSVFIRLDCKYWSTDAEKRLRAKMGTASNVRNKQHASKSTAK